MFRYLKWWEIPLFALVLPFHPLFWVGGQLERLSRKAGRFLDSWPRFQLRINRKSRLGRLVLRATGQDNPTFCQAFWSTAALPLRARRIPHWSWWTILIVLGGVFVPITSLVIYRDVRDHGLVETLRGLGLLFGLSTAAVIAMLTVIGVLVFMTRHLCPVKFEVAGNNNQANTAT